jgi:2-hydroxychromene-2-carboxylate isomerase
MDEPRTVRFYFDPRCPWAWQTSKWIREVATVRPVAIEWRLFSLALIAGSRTDLLDPRERGAHALRTLALVGREHPNERVGELYGALGERGHDRKEGLAAAAVRLALADIGLDESYVDRAWADDGTIDLIAADHEDAVNAVGAFGVPTIVLPSGRGIFGPVISVPPGPEESGELWDRVEWLTERGYFFELKRERDLKAGESPKGPPSPQLF